MKALRVAIVLAMVGVVLCIWLLVRVDWYNFVAFMMLAQPLLLAAVVLFVAVIVKELSRSGRTSQGAPGHSSKVP